MKGRVMLKRGIRFIFIQKGWLSVFHSTLPAPSPRKGGCCCCCSGGGKWLYVSHRFISFLHFSCCSSEPLDYQWKESEIFSHRLRSIEYYLLRRQLRLWKFSSHLPRHRTYLDSVDFSRRLSAKALFATLQLECFSRLTKRQSEFADTFVVIFSPPSELMSSLLLFLSACLGTEILNFLHAPQTFLSLRKYCVEWN